MFCVLPLYFYLSFRERYRDASIGDIVALLVFFAGVVTCFSLSAMYGIPFVLTVRKRADMLCSVSIYFPTTAEKWPSSLISSIT